MGQTIKNIKVSDLVLWTENPRDPIDANASDLDIIERAIKDTEGKWELNKLAREMGAFYDYSELPTVVYKDGHPVVYDGNRRVALAKMKLGLVCSIGIQSKLPDVDDVIPCNVCSEDIALQNVYRKHVIVRNTWHPLERDIFVYKYMHGEKSTFLKFDEATNGFISKNPIMNQGFVKNEVLSESILSEMGIKLQNGILMTRHSDEEVNILLNDLLEKIRNKTISTRSEYRGKPIGLLDKRTQDIITSNSDKEYHSYTSPIVPTPENSDLPSNNQNETRRRKTRISKGKRQVFFGEKLYLKSGDVNNLYSDLISLYEYVENNENSYSPNIYSIFRMGLRLLCETAAKDMGFTDIKDYIDKYFQTAKKTLDQDVSTFLSCLNVKQNSLPHLLHVGAHTYSTAGFKEQAIGISIILGAMLKISHGK